MTLEAVRGAVRAAADKKAHGIVVLDVSELLTITDHFVICSGSSERQVKTIADAVLETLRTDASLRPIRTEGEREGGWVLLDYGEFVVHIFLDEVREYYDLERLWKDAPRITAPGAEEAIG